MTNEYNHNMQYRKSVRKTSWIALIQSVLETKSFLQSSRVQDYSLDHEYKWCVVETRKENITDQVDIAIFKC